MEHINESSRKCADIMHSLTDAYIQSPATEAEEKPVLLPTEEPFQTQLGNVYPMMWPNVPTLEADVTMQDGMWVDFLAEGMDQDGLDFLATTPEGGYQWNE